MFVSAPLGSMYISIYSGWWQNIIYSRNIDIEFNICQNYAGPFIINVYCKNCAKENNFEEYYYKVKDETTYIF